MATPIGDAHASQPSFIEPRQKVRPLPEGISSYEGLLELVRYRRSIRAIDPSGEVPDCVVEKVLEAARWAPSGGNAQPWEFVVIRDDEMRVRIADLYQRQMREKREIQEAIAGKKSVVGFSGFRHCPVFVLVLGDTRVTEAYPVRTQMEKAESHFVSSLAQATVIAHLAIASLGFGSQWVSDVSSPYMSAMIRSWLGIPGYMRIYDMFGIGRPAIDPPVPKRRPLADVIHRERYESEKVRSQAAVYDFLVTHTNFGKRSVYGSTRT